MQRQDRAVAGDMGGERLNEVWWRHVMPYGDQYALVWESKELMAMHNALAKLALKQAAGYAAVEALKTTALSAIMAAVAWPATLLQVRDGRPTVRGIDCDCTNRDCTSTAQPS